MSYLTLQGIRLFYERQGEGNPPLVFVHGSACNHADWQPQVDFFRMRQCVVTCDLRGHSASEGNPTHCDIETYGADITALLSALELPPAILIGHSMGCRVVQAVWRLCRRTGSGGRSCHIPCGARIQPARWCRRGHLHGESPFPNRAFQRPLRSRFQQQVSAGVQQPVMGRIKHRYEIHGRIVGESVGCESTP
jgi:hypothetical protein